MQQVRLFFPLPTCRQLLTGVNTAYRQEINKLRKFGLNYITPNLTNLRFRNYPYKITFTFYTSDHIDAISTLTITSYILHLFETSVALQSTDYRVVPQIEVKTDTQKIDLFSKEGCLITFEELKKIR